MENKGEKGKLQQNRDASTGAAAVGEKEHLATSDSAKIKQVA